MKYLQFINFTKQFFKKSYGQRQPQTHLGRWNNECFVKTNSELKAVDLN